MAITQKTTLRKALSQTEATDAYGLSPFVALHLGGMDHIHVYRTSTASYVHTEDAPDLQDPGWVYVSHAHLKECLSCIETEDVEVGVLPNGGMILRAVNTPFATELRVHTVDRSRTAFKRHLPGPSFISLEPGWLAGLDTRPFVLCSQPVIQGDSVLLLAASGLMRWTTSYDPEVPSYPRESFLKAISGLKEGLLELTQGGYYHAVVDGMHVYTMGHTTFGFAGTGVLAKIDEPLATLPAGRLVQALRQGLSVAGGGVSLHLTAKLGITVMDQYRNVDRFSLGDTPSFPSLALSQSTAKLLVDSLSQTGDPDAYLTRREELCRLTRGICEVSFKPQTGVPV